MLDYPAGVAPRAWGQLHGESFRGEIQSLTAIRIYLCTKVGRFAGEAEVLAAAAAHLPVLQAYDADLHDELCGIAEGARLTPAHIVVANHYTDLRDLPPDPARWRPAPTEDRPGSAPTEATAPGARDAQGDGCSVLWAESPSGRILAQTWDMHATAIPYVMVLGVPAVGARPAHRVLTVTGCLGMAGMNASRVAIAINNLFSTDATLGIVWPAMVRRALAEPTAAAARDVVMGSPIGSGHHYFVADRERAFAIETSGTRRKQIFDGGPGYCHTNHCLDADIGAASKVPATSTTYDRYRWLDASLAARPIADLDDAWRRLGSQEGWPRSVSTNLATPEHPHGAATCGAIAVNLDRGELWAQAGFITNVAAERFSL
ncbi:MAG: C45 family autoproteolytic acyltransferase/hydrolase [Kofleriaceae bacterium]